jgi:hypothetical protein
MRLLWSSRAALELAPSNHWGSDIDRLTAFYASHGFQPNREEPNLFRIPGIHDPLPGHRTGARAPLIFDLPQPDRSKDDDGYH